MTYQEAQAALILLGYNLGRAGADGVPGAMTNAAIVAFKRANGLSDTTTIGPLTVAKLNAALASHGKPTGTDTAPPPVWVVEARRFLGIDEVKDKATILGWVKRLGDRAVGMAYRNTSTPWCGLFPAAVLSRCLPAEPLPAIVVRASSWDAFGRPLRALAFGAVVRFQRPGGGHVGFCVGKSADGRLIRVLGGNQSNKVTETWIETSRLVSIRWPASIKTPPLAAPIMESMGVTISRNES